MGERTPSEVNKCRRVGHRWQRRTERNGRERKRADAASSWSRQTNRACRDRGRANATFHVNTVLEPKKDMSQSEGAQPACGFFDTKMVEASIESARANRSLLDLKS